MSQPRSDPRAPVPLFSPSFVALLVANVCFGFSFSSFFLLPTFMASELGAGPRAVGAIVALHGAVVVALLPGIGAAADRRGRRGLIAGGALLMAGLCAAYPAVDTVGPLLFALRGAQAVAFAMVFAAGGALAVDLAPPARMGQAIGIYGTSFLSMNAVATFTVEALVRHSGWTAAFWLAGATALAAAVLARRIEEPPREASAAAGLAPATLRGLLARASTLRVLVVIACAGCALHTVFNFHQLYARELGLASASPFFVCYTAAALVVRFVFGHWIDRLGHRRVSLASLALYAAVVLGVSQLGRLGLPLLGAGLGLAHGVFYPSFNAVAVSLVDGDARGKLMGLFQAAFQLGAAFSGTAFGALAARAGYPAVFESAALGLVLAWGLLWTSPEGRSPDGRPAPLSRASPPRAASRGSASPPPTGR